MVWPGCSGPTGNIHQPNSGGRSQPRWWVGPLGPLGPQPSSLHMPPFSLGWVRYNPPGQTEVCPGGDPRPHPGPPWLGERRLDPVSPTRRGAIWSLLLPDGQCWLDILICSPQMPNCGGPWGPVPWSVLLLTNGMGAASVPIRCLSTPAASILVSFTFSPSRGLEHHPQPSTSWSTVVDWLSPPGGGGLWGLPAPLETQLLTHSGSGAPSTALDKLVHRGGLAVPPGGGVVGVASPSRDPTFDPLGVCCCSPALPLVVASLLRGFAPHWGLRD